MASLTYYCSDKWSNEDVIKVITDHGCDPDEFFAEHGDVGPKRLPPDRNGQQRAYWPAPAVLQWLGY